MSFSRGLGDLVLLIQCVFTYSRFGTRISAVATQLSKLLMPFLTAINGMIVGILNFRQVVAKFKMFTITPGLPQHKKVKGYKVRNEDKKSLITS